MRAILTVIGKDRVGIIAGISSELANANVNIMDISQTILQGYFTMIMFLDLENTRISFDELSKRLKKKGEELGVDVKLQHEDVFRSMHRI